MVLAAEGLLSQGRRFPILDGSRAVRRIVARCFRISPLYAWYLERV